MNLSALATGINHVIRSKPPFIAHFPPDGLWFQACVRRFKALGGEVKISTAGWRIF